MKRSYASMLCLLGIVFDAGAVVANGSNDPLKPTGAWSLGNFGDAPTPPMGWNSWNAFHTQINEAKLVGSAQAIVAKGLRAVGYRYMNIDDGWWQQRRASDGRMVIRTGIFPSALDAHGGDTNFKPLVDRLHAMGLKAGLYSDIGRNACSQGYPEADSLLPTGSVAEREVGLYDHLSQDLKLYFNEWGFDYIKVDGCGLNAFAPDRPAVRAGQFRAFPALVFDDAIDRTDVATIRGLYQQLRDELVKVRPAGDFVLSLCNWGTANVRAWGREVGNLWRTSPDIEARWTSMLQNFDSVVTRELYSGPGHWNDPDMLFIGHGDFDANHLTEARTHFALWAIEDAPLIIGYDLREAPAALVDIWGAPEIVAVNQDAAGNQGVLAYTSDDLQVIVKQLSQRDAKAVVIFNRGSANVDVHLTASQLKFQADRPIEVRDLWARRDLGHFIGEKVFPLAPRESVMLRVVGTPELAGGLYLSEMPARLFVAADGIRALQADPQIHRPVPLGEGGTRGTGPRPALAGWGGSRADSTPYNNELRIRGERFASGIGALGNSRLQVKADGQFTRFSAAVGLDDASLEHAIRLRFEVYGDGKLLAQSGDLAYQDNAYPLTADVTGVKVIELVAREVGEAHSPTLATWARAALFTQR